MNFKYSIQFGELTLFQTSISGQELKPNIFSFPASRPDSVLTLAPDNCAHIVSMPVSSDAIKPITVAEDHIVYTYKNFRRMYVDVSGSYDAYLAAFRKRSLQSLKRKQKKVAKSNNIQNTVQTFSSVSDVRTFIEKAKPISATSYQEKQLGTVFREDREWIEELEKLASQDRFRGYILYAEDKAVAYNYCPIYGDGIMLYDLSGYVPESSKYSPGTVLQASIIELAFNDAAVKIYDLCEGEGRHKDQFSTDHITCCNSYIFPKKTSYWSLVLAHYICDKTSDTLAGLLDRFGLKDRIKTFLRQSG